MCSHVCVCVFSFFLSFFLLYISVIIQSVLLPCTSVNNARKWWRCRRSAADRSTSGPAHGRRRHRQFLLSRQRQPSAAGLLAACRSTHLGRSPAVHGGGSAARWVPAAHRARQGGPRRRQCRRVCGGEWHRRAGNCRRQTTRLPRRTRLTQCSTLTWQLTFDSHCCHMGRIAIKASCARPD